MVFSFIFGRTEKLHRFFSFFEFAYILGSFACFGGLIKLIRHSRAATAAAAQKRNQKKKKKPVIVCIQSGGRKSWLKAFTQFVEIVSGIAYMLQAALQALDVCVHEAETKGIYNELNWANIER